MATEKNPFDIIPQDTPSVVPMESIEETEKTETTFELSDDGGVIVNFDQETETEEEMSAEEWYGNIADNIDPQDLTSISNNVLDNFQSDKDSRGEWESMFERGFDLLGLKLEDASEPFEGACTAVHPLLIESAVKFQAKASQELFPSSGPVKAQILGKQSVQKQEQANRVQNFMNYQLTEQMPEYFDEMERMLFHLPLIGSAFKKVYYDENLKRPVSEFVPIDQFYVSYYASDLRKADRYTHIIYKNPIDMQKDLDSGIYSDVELPEASNPTLTSFASKMDTILGLSPTADSDPQYVLLEQHVQLDISDSETEEGEYAPYIVTVEQESRQILSIRRNYESDDPQKEKRIHFVHYRFVPGFGFYGLGLIHFLGNLTMTATAAMRNLVDAAQFSNLPGGFKAKGVRMVGDNDPIAPGEFKEVEATGIDLSKAIIPLPYKEPSQTLYNMLQFVTTAGQKFADSTEQVISDAASYGPVGTTMALLEASSKFFSAIHKRLHNAQRNEFKILAKIDYDYLPTEYPYDVPNESRSIFKKDFDGVVDVLPVSDPNIPSNAHRMMLANMALQMAQQSPPGMFNLDALNRTILNAANMPNMEEILPPEPKPQPMDPVSDITAATKGMPIAAFPGQNHDAHIQVKMAYLQDPMNGANPIMQRLRPVIEANVQEHSIMKYQEQINGTTQVMLEQLPEQQRSPTALEAIMAAAAKDVLNANMATAQAQSPEQQMVTLEQARVELEKEKLKLSAVKENAEMALDMQELELKRQQQMIDAQTAGVTISAKMKKGDADRISREALKQMDIMAKMAIEEEKIQLEQQKLLNQSAVKQAEIELKGQHVHLKGLQDVDKSERQTEKDEAQLTLQLMEQMNNITKNEEK
tara:strand:- start:428 stop:3034 length:2607 start_codon:yes stop_codon:yes gene_type:complete